MARPTEKHRSRTRPIARIKVRRMPVGSLLRHTGRPPVQPALPTVRITPLETLPIVASFEFLPPIQITPLDTLPIIASFEIHPDDAAEPSRARRDLVPWTLAPLGPMLWFLDLVSAWAISPSAHHTSQLSALRGIHLGALVLAIIVAVAAWRELRGYPGPDESWLPDEGAVLVSRIAFVLAIASMLLICGNLLLTWWVR